MCCKPKSTANRTGIQLGEAFRLLLLSRLREESVLRSLYSGLNPLIQAN